MKKVFVIIASLALVCSVADAQNILGRLGDRAKNAAENAIGNKIERSINDAINGVGNKKDNNGQQKTSRQQGNQNDAAGWTCPECGKTGNTGNFCDDCGAKKPSDNAPAAQSGWTCPECGKTGNTGKFCSDCGAKQPSAAPDAAASWTCEQCGHAGNTGNFCDQCGAKKGTRKIESAYSKSDFVPGDEIIFADDFADEKLGEFPSKWDLLSGVSEVVKFDGRMTFDYQDSPTRVAPLMKDPHNYLTDEFTVELDFFAGDNSTLAPGLYSRSEYKLHFYSEERGEVMEFEFHTADAKGYYCWYQPTSGDSRHSEANIEPYLNDATWNHLAISFNKRAFKAYINGTRVINIPNMAAPQWLELESRLWGDHGVNYVSDVRIAKGAVPLYNRLTTDGKIITYAITFEVGKADLKPESMVEISRISKLMQDDPSLKFEVQGHCDNTGTAAVNDKLSQKRAEAIVAALVGEGIDASRLTAVGKGSKEPIADNSTDEGRAKNRRVEFIKK